MDQDSDTVQQGVSNLLKYVQSQKQQQQQSDVPQQPRQHRDNVTTIMEQSLQIQSKKFFFDLNVNPRGRYLKIAEKNVNRPRSVVMFPLDAIPELLQIINFYLSNLNACKFEEKQVDIGGKNFVVQFGENKNGKFLMIGERSDDRFRIGGQIYIPCDEQQQNLQQVKQILYQFLVKESELSGLQVQDIDNEDIKMDIQKIEQGLKIKYFWKVYKIQSVQSALGESVRISEQSGDRITQITLPQKIADLFASELSKINSYQRVQDQLDQNKKTEDQI